MQIIKGSGITEHSWIKEGDLANLMEAISKGEQCSVHKHGGAGRGHLLPTLSALTPQGKAFAFAGSYHFPVDLKLCGPWHGHAGINSRHLLFSQGSTNAGLPRLPAREVGGQRTTCSNRFSPSTMQRTELRPSESVARAFTH